MAVRAGLTGGLRLSSSNTLIHMMFSRRRDLRRREHRPHGLQTGRHGMKMKVHSPRRSTHCTSIRWRRDIKHGFTFWCSRSLVSCFCTSYSELLVISLIRLMCYMWTTLTRMSTHTTIITLCRSFRNRISPWSSCRLIWWTATIDIWTWT